MNYHEAQLFEMIVTRLSKDCTTVYEINGTLFTGNFCHWKNDFEQKVAEITDQGEVIFTNVSSEEPETPGLGPDVTKFVKEALAPFWDAFTKEYKQFDGISLKLVVDKVIKTIKAKIEKRSDKDQISLGIDNLNMVEHVKFLNSEVTLPFYILPNNVEIKVVSIITAPRLTVI
ncbi:hypothetical protein [Periweissella ghanensis]|uniref:Uncharacterized protein n=1 Tax=Periweissella ghanensis TaxID=467997 RepID=A0ABN8BTA9_9LACO|nr:hypothetical protein [Periweissella ghanensis]MCM0601403.1 hypothetical protein [Periweissella ghanensis]CAH0419451.1 hypothetical protein WGH24286_01910 [Periweissella ghanensis]